MSETYPADESLNALSGTSDAEQEVLYVATDEDPWYTSFYKLLYRLLDVARRAGDLRVYKDGDLTFGVRAGDYFNGDALVEYAGATEESVTDEQTNYIYLTAAGTLTVNTTGFPVPSATPHIRLATIAATGGSYDHDDVTDCRGAAFLSVARGSGSLLGLDWQESVADELDFTAAEPADPSLGDRYLNTGTGVGSETGQSVTAGRIYQWNGTSWTEHAPSEGCLVLVEDVDTLKAYDGAAWVALGTFANLKDLTDGGNADALHTHAAPGIEAGAVGTSELASGLQDLIPYLALAAGAEGGDARVIEVQLKDAAGNNLAERGRVRLWVSTADFGAPSAAGNAVVVSTGTQLREITANADYEIISDATGLAAVTITIAGAATRYIMAELDGRIYSSGAVEWAA